MSTRGDHAHTSAPPPPEGNGCLFKQGYSGMIICPAEIAFVRVNARSGKEGNELVLRSGVMIQLTYAEAVSLSDAIDAWEELAMERVHLRKALLAVYP